MTIVALAAGAVATIEAVFVSAALSVAVVEAPVVVDLMSIRCRWHCQDRWRHHQQLWPLRSSFVCRNSRRVGFVAAVVAIVVYRRDDKAAVHFPSIVIAKIIHSPVRGVSGFRQ